MNSFRYALLSLSLLTLKAVAMDVEVTEVIIEPVAKSAKERAVEAAKFLGKTAGKATKSAKELAAEAKSKVQGAAVAAISTAKELKGAAVDSFKEASAPVVEPEQSIFAKTSDVLSDVATQASDFLGKGVDFVVVKTGYGAELVAAHPVAAKATLVTGATAAAAGLTYGTYKLYRHFVPAAQAS
jgi:hypothetical protein